MPHHHPVPLSFRNGGIHPVQRQQFSNTANAPFPSVSARTVTTQFLALPFGGAVTPVLLSKLLAGLVNSDGVLPFSNDHPVDGHSGTKAIENLVDQRALVKFRCMCCRNLKQQESSQGEKTCHHCTVSSCTTEG